MNLLRAIAVLLGAFLLGACATAKNTPQQDLVLSTYNQCKAEGRVPSNIQLDRVEPDGRAWYSAYKSSRHAGARSLHDGKDQHFEDRDPTRLPAFHTMKRPRETGSAGGIHDRFTDEEGEWEIATRPWTTHGGKMVHAAI